MSELPECYHRLFEAHVQCAPDAPALEFGESVLSYADVDRHANRLARHLLARGIGRESLVGVALGRSPDMIIALLAIAKAGAAYVPIDPGEDTARRDEIIAASSLAGLIVDGRWRRRIMESQVALVDLITDAAIIASADDSNPGVEVTGRNLAYLLHTSGSSGRPKAIAMEHASLFKLIRWHGEGRRDACGLRTLQFCSIGFDFSFHEIFSTLCHGGTLVIAGSDERLDPYALARMIRNRSIEKVFLPVSALLQWAEAVDEASFPTRLRHVFTTGEQLQITPALRAICAGTGASVHNHYGATEFQDAATLTLSGDPATWPDVVPIGQPLFIRRDLSETD